MSSFYITLISDSSMELFPNNTQCCFRTKLPKPIVIDQQNWEMALVELIVPSQVRNIDHDESIFYIVTTNATLATAFQKAESSCEIPNKKGGTKWALRCCIPEGSYATPNHLAEEIDKTIKETVGELLKENNVRFGLEFSNLSKRIKFTGNSTKSKVGLRFHPRLLMKLGGEGDEDVYPDKANNSFSYGVDLNMGINHLFIYSDLPEYTIVGDVEVPILRVVPFETRMKAGTSPHLHMEFLNLHYVSVNKSSFDEISINISGDTGERVHFIQGKSMVKLHFRRKIK